jgi:hypothetical protein
MHCGAAGEEHRMGAGKCAARASARYVRARATHALEHRSQRCSAHPACCSSAWSDYHFSCILPNMHIYFRSFTVATSKSHVRASCNKGMCMCAHNRVLDHLCVLRLAGGSVRLLRPEESTNVGVAELQIHLTVLALSDVIISTNASSFVRLYSALALSQGPHDKG